MSAHNICFRGKIKKTVYGAMLNYEGPEYSDNFLKLSVQPGTS